ncbi:MAG TPA: hypothetical protein VLN26_13835, partial [Gaiellaceae bacterium]|nr:hypothetical protein [Gaiellaceae bacterium]
QNTIQGWFNSWSQNIPNFRNPELDYSGISAYSITTSTFLGFVTSRKIRVIVAGLHVSYERGVLTPSTPVLIQPPAVTVDPPPFVYKQPATFTVEGIQGRVIVNGGDTVQSAGDAVVVHNSGGLANSGLLINRQLPRYEQTGENPATGNPIFAPQLDENGDPVVSTYVSLEGLGMNIPLDGFVGPDTVSTYGVYMQGIENMDLRLADESYHGTGASRNDNVTVALAQLRGADDKNQLVGGVLAPTDARLQHMNVRLVLGAGNDQVTLVQTTGNVTVLGGGGSDTVTIADDHSLSHILGEVRFDGTAHVDEQTSLVSTIASLGLGSSPAFPNVFVGTANPTLSFVDANGKTIYYSLPVLQPIVYQNGSHVSLNVITLRSDGTIITDLVQEQGIQATDPVTGLPIYLDANGNATSAQFDANGFPNRKVFAASMSGPLLYLDSAGNPTAVAPSNLAIDNSGSDITVYARPVGTPDFSTVSVQVSNNGTTWITARPWTNLAVPGDGGVSSTFYRSYDINQGNSGATFKYVRVSATGTFQLDAIGLLPNHGGPDNSSTTTAFPTVIAPSLTSVPPSLVPGAAGAPNGVYVDLGGAYVTFASAGRDLPATISVNRMTSVDFTKTVDVQVAVPGGTDQLLVDAASDPGIGGTLDTTPTPFDQIDSSGAIVFNSGTVTEEHTQAAGQTTVTLGQAVIDPALLTVIAKRQLGSGEFSLDTGTMVLALGSAPAASVVVQVRYQTLAGLRTQTFAPGASTLTLVDTPTSALTVETFETLSVTASSSTLTVPGTTVARTLVVNYPASQRFYFGGEQIFTAAQDTDGRVVLTPAHHAVGDLAYDVHGGAPLDDPWQVQLVHTTADALLAFEGDPLLHYAGELRRYLGGEPVLDESGRPVVNFDGSLFLHSAGQVAIQNRGADAYVPGALVLPYTGSTVTLTGATLTTNPNADLVPVGWSLDLARDHVVAVVVHTEQGIFALYQGAGFTLTGGTLTLAPTTGQLAKMASGTVTLEVTVALRAFHHAGDVMQWTGTEAVVDGDPVVTGSGGVYTVSTDSHGRPLTYTTS